MNPYDTIIDLSKVVRVGPHITSSGDNFVVNNLYSSWPVYRVHCEGTEPKKPFYDGEWYITGDGDPGRGYNADDVYGMGIWSEYSGKVVDGLYGYFPVSSEQISYPALEHTPLWIPVLVKEREDVVGYWCLCRFGEFVFGEQEHSFDDVWEMRELGIRAYYGPNVEPWEEESDDIEEEESVSFNNILISWET